MLQVGRMISFVGSTVALAIMTVISVVIGYGFKSVPDALKSSIPVGHYLSVACLLYFGVKTLKVCSALCNCMIAYTHYMTSLQGLLAGWQDAWQTPSSAEAAEGGELASAQESLQEAQKSGTLERKTSLQSLLQASNRTACRCPI
jgi:hypothetical protein